MQQHMTKGWEGNGGDTQVFFFFFLSVLCGLFGSLQACANDKGNYDSASIISRRGET